MVVDDDDLHGNGKNKPPPPRRRRCRYCCSGTTAAATLLMIVLTNAVSVAVVSSGTAATSSSWWPSAAFLLRRYSRPAATLVRLWDTSAALHADLNATQAALAAGRADLAALHARVRTANELLNTLLRAMREHDNLQPSPPPASTAIDAGGWKRELAGELKLAGVGPHHEVIPMIGHACVRVQDDLERYMDYVPGGDCPSDEPLEHRLLLSGCEPLPRRRCRPRSPKGFPQPTPLPTSLWTTPPDTSVVWDAYACKNYSCLASASGAISGGGGGGGFDLRHRRGKNNSKAAGDGADGDDDDRWARDDGALSYSIDAVLSTRPNGTVRIGVDLGGGGGNGGSAAAAGTFAARMLERAGATVLTAAVNSGGAPVGSFVASRGLVPLHVTAAHGRLPLFDGTMDIVHAGRDLAGAGDGGGGVMMLELALYDVYRVLRPGGLFWLDHFVCAAAGTAAQVNVNATTLAPLLDRVGFRKLRWNTGRGKEKKKDQWYVSALLEKPMS